MKRCFQEVKFGEESSEVIEPIERKPTTTQGQQDDGDRGDDDGDDDDDDDDAEDGDDRPSEEPMDISQGTRDFTADFFGKCQI